MGRIALEPYGAPEMTPNGWAPSPTVLSGGITGWDGKNGIRCFFLWENFTKVSFCDQNSQTKIINLPVVFGMKRKKVMLSLSMESPHGKWTIKFVLCYYCKICLRSQSH